MIFNPAASPSEKQILLKDLILNLSPRILVQASSVTAHIHQLSGMREQPGIRALCYYLRTLGQYESLILDTVTSFKQKQKFLLPPKSLANCLLVSTSFPGLVRVSTRKAGNKILVSVKQCNSITVLSQTSFNTMGS